MSDGVLMTVTQTAEYLGFCRHTVGTMIRRGELAFVPGGRKAKRIPRFEADRWVREHLVRSSAGHRKALDGRRK